MLAIVSPGQGSQFTGMLSPWLEMERNRELVQSWGSVAKKDIYQLGVTGTSEEIKSTDNAQLLILATSILSSLELEITPSMDEKIVFAGHSVGEISAYAVANAYSFNDAIKLVSTRGTAMHEASKSNVATGMSAVLGGDKEQVIASLIRLDLVPANINSGKQIIAAGKSIQLEKLLLNPPKNSRVKPLEIAAAFHTNFMLPALNEFRKLAHSFSVNFVAKKLISNNDGELIRNPIDLIEKLINQIVMPVRWDLCQAKMVELGVTGMLELAPGGTLCGIAKKEIPSVETFAIKSPEDLQGANEFIRKHIG